MDIDISDILADVSKPTAPSTSHPANYDSSSSHTDHQLLVRAWTSERCSPSLLPYPTSLVERVMSRIQTQISRIEDLTSGVDFDAGHGGRNVGGIGGRTGNNTNLILSIIQTDLSRTQFVLRSYLRQRLDKITKNAGWFLKFHAGSASSSTSTADEIGSSTTTTTTTTMKSPLLSKSEVQFLRTHQSLLVEFYDSSFLASFPLNLRRLDDSAGGVNMVEAPDGGAGVVVRCLKEEWGNAEDVDRGSGEDGEEGPDVELRFRRGEVWVVRWRDVRRGVVEGDLECL